MRAIVPNRSNNEIVLVLQHFDNCVDRTVQAFMEGNRGGFLGWVRGLAAPTRPVCGPFWEATVLVQLGLRVSASAGGELSELPSVPEYRLCTKASSSLFSSQFLVVFVHPGVKAERGTR